MSRHRTVLYFATDLHGSEKCFRKFLNAGPVYGGYSYSCAPAPRVGAFATAPWTDQPACQPYVGY